MKTTLGFFLLLIHLAINAQTSLNKRDKVDTLSLEDRLWGVTLLWHEVKSNFAYYDKLGFDWDSTYKATIIEVINTPDRFHYYQLLKKVGAKLHDGHTNVFLPADLREKYAFSPPLRLKRIGQRVFIESVLNDTLRALGLSRGDEIILINSVPLVAYAEKNIRPFVSASTPQDEANRTYSNELLSGPKEDNLRLTLRNNEGKTKNVLFKRGLSLQRSPFPPVSFHILPQNIGLLTLNTFSGDTLKQAFERIMAQVGNCSALIIDLRRNGGGNGENAYALQEYFFSDGYFDTQGHSRMHVSAWQSFGYPKADIWLSAPKDSLWVAIDTKVVKFLKPVVILTGEKTFSAAEDFTAILKQNKRAIIIGQATGGSTGMNEYHPLPGGGNFRITVKKDTFIDGTAFIGVGIQPDIEVHETVDDFLKDKDVVLQKAINYFKKK